MINEKKFFEETGMYTVLAILISALIVACWMMVKINYVAISFIAITPLLSFIAIKKELSVFTKKDFQIVAMWALFISAIALFFIMGDLTKKEDEFVGLFAPSKQGYVASVMVWVFWVVIIGFPILNYNLYSHAQKRN